MRLTSICSCLAAVQRDEELGVSAKSRRTVNSSTRQENFFPYSGDGYIDSDFRDLTIQAAARRPDPTRRPYIEEDLWYRLPPEAQQILRSMNPKSANATPSRGVNSHDLFYTETPAVDDAWPEEETHDPVPEDEPAEEQLVGDDLPPDPMSTPEEEDHSPILAHVTQRHPFPPGDVRRLLAANRSAPPRRPKPKAPPLHQQRSSNPSPNKNKQSIILNGKRYVEADVHRITLDITASATTKVASLVDRGS